MSKKLISEEKLYELALDEKKHHETRRDDINAHYISLFAAIVAVTPFIENLVDAVPGRYEWIVIRISLTVLSSIGLILAIIWSANLRRILFFIEYLDKVTLKLEKKHDISFKTDLSNLIEKQSAPDRITKYQLMMPRMFILVFSCVIIYSLTCVFIFVF